MGQVTDPRATEYIFLLNQLQNDLTLYNQASQGGGSQAPTDALRNEAKEIISIGASQGSLEGLLGGLQQSIAGMTVVNQEALNRARQRVWGLFGVGDAYQATESGVPEVRPDYVPIEGLSPVDAPGGTGTPPVTGGGFDASRSDPVRVRP